jgi:SAM-dependent methyltransferase
MFDNRKRKRAASAGLMLDLGCGIQKPPSDCIGIDLSQEAVRLRKALYPDSIAIQADILRLPIRGKVGGIFAGLVFDHLEHPEIAFAEIARVADPKAMLIITIFEPNILPTEKYGPECFKYISLSGNSYLVPLFRISVDELVSFAFGAGWIIVRPPLRHILPDSEYCLIEIVLQMR